MARTTTRAQMIIGMMLTDLDCLIGNYDELSPVSVGDRNYEQLNNDADYMHALNIVSCLLKREIKKNEARLQGSYAGTLDDINEITMTEA